MADGESTRDAVTFEFDADGFLTDRISEFEAVIQTSCPVYFQKSRKLNNDCHKLLFSTPVRNRDPKAVAVASLLMRALEHYQAVNVLLARGMIVAARVSLRALIEGVFKLRAIVQDEEAFKVFLTEDSRNRKKTINKINSYPHLFSSEGGNDGLSESFKEADDHICAVGVKEFRVEEWSRRAGMHDWYILVYSQLSQAIHTQPRDLESHMVFGMSGEVEKFNYVNSIEKIPFLLLTSMHVLLVAIAAFDNNFDSEFESKGTEYKKFIDDGFESLCEDSI